MHLIILLLYVLVFLLVLFFKKEKYSSIDFTSNLNTDELRQKIFDLEESLHNCKISNQTYQSNLLQCQSQLVNKQPQQQQLPERVYQNPNDTSYQILGFVYKDNERYPLYGRHKYPGRSDRWEYYIVDETRNRLKIPFTSKNDYELYNNDSVDIPTLGNSYSVKLYDYEQYKYRY